MLDDSDFRLGVPGVNGKMRVKEADQNYKKGTAANRDRQKVIKKAEEMNRYASKLLFLIYTECTNT